MRKTLLFIISIAALSFSACNDAFTQKEKVNLFPACPLVGEQLLCGYIDKAGKMAIQPQYANAGQFHDGLAVVSGGSNQPRHYIDEKGQIVISGVPYGKSFSDGLLPVVPAGSNGLYGYIDTKQNVVIQPQFFQAFSFSEGLAPVSFGGSKYPLKYAYIDKSGKVVLEVNVFSSQLLQPFYEGLAFVCNEESSCSFIDRNGKSVIRGIPSEQGWKDSHPLDELITNPVRFSEGLAAICDYSGKLLPSKGCGYIDKSGKAVIEPKLDNAQTVEVRQFSEGLAPVRFVINNVPSYGFIDRSGNVAIQPKFDYAQPFSGGLARVKIPNPGGQSYGSFLNHDAYIDKKGNVVWDAFNNKIDPKSIQPSGRPLEGED